MNDEIVHINDKIKASISHCDVKSYNLADSVSIRGDEEITFPAIILQDGECVNVYGETDKHDVTLYHRLNDVSFQEESASSYGSGKGYSETADMSLIVFGKRASISPYEMELIARKAIADRSRCTLTSSSFNALQIFASEYVGVTYFIPPDYFLFKINYKITSTYNTRCNKN